MPAINDKKPHDRLYEVAEAQAGYFRADQAVAAGVDHSLLRKHAREGGRYERVGHGLYRLRRFPTSPHEHVVASWVAVGPPAVVSHESALELHELSDVVPDAVHLTLPRNYRGRRSDRARLHFSTRPPALGERGELHGVPVTSPERSIVDSLESGAQPEQVEAAVKEALERGMTSPRRLARAASDRPERGPKADRPLVGDAARALRYETATAFRSHLSSGSGAQPAMTAQCSRDIASE